MNTFFENFSKQDLLVYTDWLLALGIFASALIAGKLVSWLFKATLRAYSKKSKTKFDDALTETFRKPVTWGIILLGLYVALKQPALLQSYAGGIARGFKIASVLLGAWLVKLLVDAFLIWIREQKGVSVRRFDSVASGIRKAIQALIIILAVIFVLQIAGFEITPLLTSLGIGGLAVALALQDTLANYFAGLSINAGGVIRPGDFIEFPDGKQGFVQRIGWRNAEIKTLANNIIVIPNGELAKSQITNYSTPQEEAGVLIDCGVSYGSDLETVERVTVEVAKHIMKSVEGGVPEFEPFIRYKTFGDSNINFSVMLRAQNTLYRYALTHEFIKALKKRYDEESIEIAFPTRTVYMTEKN